MRQDYHDLSCHMRSLAASRRTGGNMSRAKAQCVLGTTRKRILSRMCTTLSGPWKALVLRRPTDILAGGPRIGNVMPILASYLRGVALGAYVLTTTEGNPCQAQVVPQPEASSRPR